MYVCDRLLGTAPYRHILLCIVICEEQNIEIKQPTLDLLHRIDDGEAHTKPEPYDQGNARRLGKRFAWEHSSALN